MSDYDSHSDERIISKKEDATDDFIGEFFIDDLSVCDELITFFESHDYAIRYKSQGECGHGIDEKVKKSTDLTLDLTKDFPANQRYMQELQKCCLKYIEKFPACDLNSPWAIIEPYNIQHYAPGEGYYAYHSERGGTSSLIPFRHLVWMTYLNDVPDGGTEFYHQKKYVPAEKGKTLIWPVDWTYTHRGVPSPTKNKYIITGWYTYYRNGYEFKFMQDDLSRPATLVRKPESNILILPR